MTKEDVLSLYRGGQLEQARVACETYLQSEPADPEVWTLLSTINGSLGIYEDAELCGIRAMVLAPDNTQACFNTAVAQYNLKKPKEAIAGFRTVLGRQPDHGFALYLMGRCYEMQVGQDKEAMACYEAALHLHPQPPHLAVHLINLYERLGDQDKALELLERSLQTRPNDHRLVAIRARIDADNGLVSEARNRLELLIDSGALTEDERAGIFNKLGKLYDRLGDYDRAYESFEACHRIDSGGIPESDTTAYYDIINRYRKVTTPGNVIVWQQNMPKNDLPSPIFLVGFHRSGTTLVERMIATHPDVRVSSEEGLLEDVISRLNAITGSSLGYPYNLNDLTKEQVTVLQDEYWRMARQKCDAMPDRRFLDKSPLNIIDLCLIYRIFPDARIVVMLRDPRDVCLSCFMQRFDRNQATVNFLDLESTVRFYDATMKLWTHYEETLDLTKYILRYENVVSDTETSMKDLFRFLDLRWDDRVLRYHDNRDYKALTPSYNDTGKPIFTSAIGRWRFYVDHMQPVMQWLEPHIIKHGYDLNASSIGSSPD